MKIAVIVPAYNEEANIARVVERVKKVKGNFDLKVIVVNDASTDNTEKEALRSGATVLSLPVNLGIGGAVQTGIIYAYEQGYDAAVQIDGDGQHLPNYIPELLKTLRNKKADVLIGSRFITGEGFQSSSLRRAGIRYLQGLLKVLTGLHITDATSGMRLYNRKAMASIKEYYPDEYPEPEALVYFYKKQLKIEECPVVMEARQGGKSSITPLNSLYYLWKVSLAILYTYLKS